MTRFLIGLFITTTSFAALAQEETALRFMASNPEEVVIAEELIPRTGFEDPLFAQPEQPRDVAELSQEVRVAQYDWQGDLTVLKEIPYTYPAVTRKLVEMRTINEIEAEESAQKTQ